jgi:hypothetical protein
MFRRRALDALAGVTQDRRRRTYFEVGTRPMGDSDKVGLRHTVPGVLSGIGTTLTAAAGLIGVLYQTGYIGNRATPSNDAAVSARASVQATDKVGPLAAVDAPAVPRPDSGGGNSPVVAATHPRLKNLNGAWRDGGSNCHQISQAGHALTVTSYFADNRLWAIGNGTVKGGIASMKLNAANPASPEADLVLSDDGHVLSGMMKGAKGAHVARWRFAGPSCVQTAARPQ